MSDGIAEEADRNERLNSRPSGHHDIHNNDLSEIPAEPIDDAENRTAEQESAAFNNERSPLLGRHRRSSSVNDIQNERMVVAAGFLFLRSIAFVLFIFSVLWLLLLLIDIFVSFPAVESRDSGFVELDATLIAISSLLISLYGTPTKLDFILGFSSAGLIFFQGLIVLCTPSLRHRHGGGVGMLPVISFGTSSLLVLLSTITHRGHVYHVRDKETLSFKQWVNLSTSVLVRSFLWLCTFLMAFSFIFQLYDAISNKPEGEFVPIDSGAFNVHLFCTERGSTDSLAQAASPKEPSSNLTIVVEGGETSSEEFASWILDSDVVNEYVRVCYYDRPGLAYSDCAPSPMSAGGNADSLSQALATIPGFNSDKLLLISHGIGGIYSRIFAARHSANLNGIMLVDTTHEDRFLKEESTWLGFKYFVRGLVSPLGLYQWRRVIPFVGPGKHKLVRTPGYFKAKLQEQITAKTLSRNEVLAANALIPPQTPLVVVSSGNQIKKVSGWSEQQRQLTELTQKNLAWDILEGPHNIWQNKESKEKLQKLLADIITYTK